MRIAGRVVVITGASSGIGRATAHALAERGANLVLASRSEPALREVAAECAARGADTLVVPTDVTDAVAVTALAREAVQRFDRIDVWVNNAAVTAFGSFVDTPASDIRRVLDVNVMGYVHGAQEALRQFRTQGSGTLINVASIVGGLSQPYAHAYVMSKHAVRALTCSIRQELCLTGDRGIRVCAVLPSTVDTPLFQHAANRTGRAVVAMPPVYRPEQVANAVLRAVRHPRREVVVGTSGRLMMAQWRWAPALTERMLARQVDRTHLSDEPAPDSPGNLYFSADRLGAVHGGWHGQRRTAMRQVILAAAAVGVVSASIVGYRRRT